MNKFFKITALLALVACFSITSAQADLQMPKKPNFYDKLGRGIANIVGAVSEIPDSTYQISKKEGGTIGYTKGFVQGSSRTVMNVFHGVFDIVTSPIPSASLKQPAYDTGVVHVYPPADLEDWY